MENKTLICMIIRNVPGVLSKISGAFSDNSINIDKLTISNFITNNYAEQRAILSAECSFEQIQPVLEKLKTMDLVLRYYHYLPDNYIQRELLVLKVHADDPKIEEITELTNEYQGKTIYFIDDMMIFEFANEEEKNKELMQKLSGITQNIEILQSGIVAVSLDDNMNN